MIEPFDATELAAVSVAFQEFETRCDQILLLLSGKFSLTASERADVARLYQKLKADLEKAAKYGTVSGTRSDQTCAEQYFYHRAAHRAYRALRPATNTNPILSDWYAAVSEARAELSYWRSYAERAASR